MKTTGRQKTIHILIGLGLIGLLTISVINSIYVNPGDAITYQLDSPLESYTFNEPYNLSRLTHASTFIVFNDTGFNVTPANAISIRIDHIDEDIENPADGSDNLLVFTVTNTPGNTVYNLSGFEPTISYTVKINTVFYTTVIADGSGVISFSDNPNSNDEYSIYWTAGSNQAPTITNPSPSDLATGISTSPTLQVDINDPDGNPMTYYIKTNESGLDWYTVKTASGQSNSTVSTATTGNFTASYTKYYWCVNLTDGVVWTNSTYSFTTTGTGTPVVQTNEATNIQEINATLSGTLLNDGGEDCLVWFEWDDTTALLDVTDNQTASSSDDFTVSLLGNLTEWYNNNWVRRKQITISNAYVDSDLTNYPVYINISGDYSLAETDGHDILFTSGDGTTKISHELVRFTSKTYLEAWINVSKVFAANDTIIYMYWGNNDCSNQWNIGNTWTDLYVGVYHLDEATGSGSTCYDSSGNDYDATYYGDLPNRNISFDGYAQYLDGDGDYISFPEDAYNLVHGNSAGYMAFVKQADRRNMPYWFTSNNNDPALDNQKTLTRFNDASYELRWHGAENTSAYSSWSTDPSWYPFGGHFNPQEQWWMQLHQWNPNVAFLYANLAGNNMETFSHSGIPDVGTFRAFYFGYDTDSSYPASQQYYKGYVDEIRIYQQTLSSSWIKTDNYNFNEQAGFITVGDEESKYYDTGILSPGTNYFYRAIANNTSDKVYGDVQRFLTRPTQPELLAALTENQSGIQLTWTNGTNNNRTYIERSTSSTPWVRGTEINIYNSSKPIYNDTGLELGVTYYYQAWSYTNWTDNSTTLNQFSRTYDYANNKTNSLPAFTNVYPVNDSTTDVSTNLSLYISDQDGHTFNYTIETDPDIGSNSHNDATNGTVYCRVNGSHTTTYKWYVNCTDSYDWTNATYTFTYFIDHVDVPTNGSSDYHPAVQYLYLNWTGNTRANTYTLVRRTDTYSSSATQSGNTVVQNTSALFYNVSWTETDGGYFTVFSYNSTANMHSYNNATPQGLDIEWGALVINVYNESNMSQGIVGWDIEISNEDSTEVYTSYDNTNPLYLDINDIPYGVNTIFYITNNSYYERTDVETLVVNKFYGFNYYLPPYISPSPPGGGDPGGGDDGGGGNTTTTRLYRFRVVDEYNYPINDATVEIRKYNNITGEYINISTIITSGYGEGDIYLIPNTHYRAFVSKTDYTSDVFDWIPDPSYYGPDYPKIFQLSSTTAQDDLDDIYTFYDFIIFNATLHTNGSMFVNYIDNNLNTTNAQFYVYENYNFSTTYITTESTTSNTFSFWVNNLNSSRQHEIFIYLNHSVLGFEINSIIINPVSDAEYDDGGEIEQKVENVFGPYSLGYVQVFLVYLPLMVLLVLPGPKHPGFAIIMASLYGAFASSFIVVGSILMIIPFAIAIGVILMAVKGGVFKL